MHDTANCWQFAPSPDGEGWGEENLKSTYFVLLPHPALSRKEREYCASPRIVTKNAVFCCKHCHTAKNSKVRPTHLTLSSRLASIRF